MVKRIKLNGNNHNNSKVYETFMNYNRKNPNDVNNGMTLIDETNNSRDIGEVLFNINKPDNKFMINNFMKDNDDIEDYNDQNLNSYSKSLENDEIDKEYFELDEKTKNISKNLFSSETKNERSNNGTPIINHEKIEYNEFYEFENLIISHIKKETSFDVIFGVIQNNRDKLSINVFKRLIEEGIRRNSPFIIKSVFLIAKSVKDIESLRFSAEDFQYFLSLIEYRESDIDTFNEVLDGLKESNVNPPALFIIHICSLYIKFKCIEGIDNILNLYSVSFLTNRYQKKQAIHRLISIMIDKRLISQTYNFFIFLDKNNITIKEKDFISLGALCVDDNFVNPNVFTVLSNLAVKHVAEYTTPYMYWEKILVHCSLKNKVDQAVIIYRKLIKFYLPSIETLKLYLDFSCKHNNLNDFMKRFICNFKILNSESVKQFTSNSLSVPFLNDSINYCIESNLYSHAMWVFIFMIRHKIKVNDDIYIKLLVVNILFKPRDVEDLVEAVITNQPQIDLNALSSVVEEFHNHKKFNLAGKLLVYIKSKSYFKCCIDVNIQLNILLHEDNVDEAYKLFLSSLNNNDAALDENSVKKLIDRLIYKTISKKKNIQFNNIWLVFEYLRKVSNFTNINRKLFISLIKLIIQENQWTKGMEILKFYGQYHVFNYDKSTFLGLFKTIDNSNKEFNSRKEGFIISLFIFCCQNKIINFNKDNIKNGIVVIEEGFTFSIIRLIFIQALEYINKHHPEINKTTSTSNYNRQWWSKEFKIVLPSSVKYKGKNLENEKFISTLAEEFKKLNPSFDIYEESNRVDNSKSASALTTKKSFELILDKTYIFNWIKSVNNNLYTIFDIIGINSPINSTLELSTLIVNDDCKYSYMYKIFYIFLNIYIIMKNINY